MQALTNKPKMVILISGSGSNMQRIIEACQSAQIDADIAAVISNNEQALGLQKAQQLGIETQVVAHNQFVSKAEFEENLIHVIDGYQPDLIVLAGFMRILSSQFVLGYLGKILNIHPSLLPKYPGLHTHQRVLESGDKEHGASVHFVIPELDAGPNIAQVKVTIQNDDTPESIQKRVLQQEHILYPIVIAWFIDGRLELNHNQVLFDGQPLPRSGLVLEA